MKTGLATTLALLVLIPTALGSGNPSDQTSRAFTAFWAEFKTAVAKNDREAVASMTKFPFDNGKMISRAQFFKSYDRIFDQAAQKCFTQAKPEKEEEGSYRVSCGRKTFVFDLMRGKYRFIGIGERLTDANGGSLEARTEQLVVTDKSGS